MATSSRGLPRFRLGPVHTIFMVPESRVIGVPGKGERCGSKGACAPLDSANRPSLWLGRALQGEQRRMARRARRWRVHSDLTQMVRSS